MQAMYVPYMDQCKLLILWELRKYG